MTTKTYRQVYGQPPPQSEPIPGREAEMVRNNAGGFAFKVDDWTRLERFLTLGTEGGTYYVCERKLTRDNAAAVRRCIESDGGRAVNRTREISESGRAAKNDPALFALAMAAAFGDADTKRAVAAALPCVARTGTHLLHFVSFMNDMRGWGRWAKRAVGRWYLERDRANLCLQLLKYRQRDGWTHRDVLRLSHPNSNDRHRDALLRWVAHPDEPEPRPLSLLSGAETRMVAVFEQLQKCSDPRDAAVLLREEPWLTREMVPTDLLAAREVWEALLPHLPMTALLRNLPALTRHGLLGPLSNEVKQVAERLTDKAALRKARIHPLAVLIAHMTYKEGRSARGAATWEPVPEIVDALDDAFTLAFEGVDEIDARIYAGVDISGSMGFPAVRGLPALTPCVGAAAMALVFARKARQCVVRGFADGRGRADLALRTAVMRPLEITGRASLNEAVEATRGIPFGGTDCALPMLDALKNRIPVDAFVILTDNETWAGKVHPMDALNRYRSEMNIPARMVVVAMTASEVSIADPEDAGSLDVAGFDASVPRLVEDFVRA